MSNEPSEGNGACGSDIMQTIFDLNVNKGRPLHQKKKTKRERKKENICCTELDNSG